MPSPAWLLEIGDMAASAIGDASLGDLFIGNGVGGCDVLRPDDTGNLQFADFVIDANFLAAMDHKISVGGASG